MRRRRSIKLLTGLALVGMAAGGYILAVSLSPAVPYIPPFPKHDTTSKRLEKPAGTFGDRLYIPQINVDVAIVLGSDASALEKGAWHRQPQNGDPEKGGNFVLSAHRFNLGLTPQGTRAKSPFYHLDKLNLGDVLTVDYHGKRYTYQITKKYGVMPTQTEIEAPSDTPIMTLYSCKLGGSAAGRDVIEAVPVSNN